MLESYIDQLKGEYYVAKRINEEYEEKLATLKETNDCLDNVSTLLYIYDGFLSSLKEKKTEIREVRRSDFENNLTQYAEMFFPEEDFVYSLSLYDNRGKDCADLLVSAKGSKPGSVRYRNGRFAQQLQSVVASTYLLKVMGVSTAFMDEPFSSTDTENIKMVPSILEGISDMQVIYVEHKSEAYESIPHRKFVLEKDRFIGITNIKEVIDYGLQSE